MLKSNQLSVALKETKNEFHETKRKLDEAEDDINEKYIYIYIDKSKEIQEKNDYQNNEIKNR